MSVKKLEVCSIGKESETECHKKSFTQVENLLSITSLDQSEINLLSLRSGVSCEPFYTVCEHHKTFFLKKFEIHQKTCFDPFKCHKKKITKSLRIVSLDLSKKINEMQSCVKSIPGQKICNVCRSKVNKYITKLSEEYRSEEMHSLSDEEISNLKTSVSKHETLEDINSSLQNIGESPIKLHGIATHSKSSYAKRKLESACNTLKSKVSKVLETFPTENESQNLIQKEIIQKASDMDVLIQQMKTKLNATTITREKVQILTLAPTSWGRKKVCEEFNVTEYTVRKARELLKNKGIMALPEPRKGHPLSENIVAIVTKFYQSDEYSRIMPGLKDKISISRNVHMQKRLLLSNLNELYSAFKFEYPDLKIGLSKFCLLRPKWCVLAGSSGTHSVCVCTIHQNVRLLLYACNMEDTYSNMIDQLVCSKDSRDCMLRHCLKCPPKENIKKFIIGKFEEWDPNDTLTYNSWISTDRTQQVQFTVTFEDYLETLMEGLELLIPHSFITKSQARYLKETKANLKTDEVVAILDFSENYSFVMQDEAQGYHWTHNSCTLHPAVIYTHSGNSADLVISSLCIISDDLEHDVPFVYEIQKIIVQYVKETFPRVKNIHYFSDGCAAQYKNCKNFLNLCYHKNDFNLSATWSFFATSHGKSPCDGIGGTVKRLVTKASLQMTRGNTIDSAEKFLSFCKTKILNIKFWMIKKETLTQARQQLEIRFSKAKTVPGTRSFHHFVPQSEDAIGTKRTSFDENYCTIFHFSGEKSAVKMSDISVHNYVACTYDDHWFFGLVLSKHESEGDIKVKFLHPHGSAPSFHWPSKEDICFIPICNIIACINSPITKGSGRVYYFPEKDVGSIHHQCTKLLKKTDNVNKK